LVELPYVDGATAPNPLLRITTTGGIVAQVYLEVINAKEKVFALGVGDEAFSP
jgi:hypothetical protein